MLSLPSARPFPYLYILLTPFEFWHSKPGHLLCRPPPYPPGALTFPYQGTLLTPLGLQNSVPVCSIWGISSSPCLCCDILLTTTLLPGGHLSQLGPLLPPLHPNSLSLSLSVSVSLSLSLSHTPLYLAWAHLMALNWTISKWSGRAF